MDNYPPFTGHWDAQNLAIASNTTIHATSSQEVEAETTPARSLPARSCANCRRRKIGCDKRRPCFNCVKMKVQLVCTSPTRGSISSSEIRGKLKAGVKGEVKGEVKAEVKGEVKADIKAEVQREVIQDIKAEEDPRRNTRSMTGTGSSVGTTSNPTPTSTPAPTPANASFSDPGFPATPHPTTYPFFPPPIVTSTEPVQPQRPPFHSPRHVVFAYWNRDLANTKHALPRLHDGRHLFKRSDQDMTDRGWGAGVQVSLDVAAEAAEAEETLMRALGRRAV